MQLYLDFFYSHKNNGLVAINKSYLNYSIFVKSIILKSMRVKYIINEFLTYKYLIVGIQMG